MGIEILRHSHRLPRPRPLLPLPPLDPKLFFGPSMSMISLLLKLNVPPANLPTAGAPTPVSLFPAIFALAAFWRSKMIPFSRASRLLISSRSTFLAVIPFLWDMGIFSCFSSELLAPRVCRRMSVATCRFLPDRVGLLEDSRRWDSARSRCRARSCFKFAASVSSSSASSAAFLPFFVFRASVDVVMGGGFELCRSS